MKKTKRKNQTTGQLIRDARLGADLTQVQLAEATGIDQPQLSKYELDKIEPEIATLRRLAEAMGGEWKDLVA